MLYEEKSEALPFTPDMEATLRTIALDRAPARLALLATASDDAEAFVHLPSAAAAAFHLRQFADARQFAERALALAPSFTGDWNHGNAIHLGHAVLGLLALQAQDEPSAVMELHESGTTPGSPQLNSFSPTMHLAKALLRAGHVNPVLCYLDQCRPFWAMGASWLALWERKIREGKVPNFFQHSHA